MTQALQLPPNVSFRDEHPDLGDGRAAIVDGLRADPKRIDPMWLYDQRGSELFDEITRLPEYYPSRTEIGILGDNRADIAACCGEDCLLIEPGSGSSEKVRLFLDALRPQAYVPVDISASYLRDAAAALGVEYPWLSVHAVCADFNASWSFLDDLPRKNRVVFYPGSTLGNLEPTAAREFLAVLRGLIGDDGGVLIGVDTHKDEAILNAAYNDSAGVTAAFNLNLLDRLNSLVGADFDATRFRHHAFYNQALRRIEMHLVSLDEQRVALGDGEITFAAGETIHTESSYKYTDEGFAELAQGAGLKVTRSWHDEAGLFGVHFLRAS